MWLGIFLLSLFYHCLFLLLWCLLFLWIGLVYPLQILIERGGLALRNSKSIYLIKLTFYYFFCALICWLVSFLIIQTNKLHFLFFDLALIPKYIDKPIKRITSNELLFPRISISIFVLDILKSYCTYINSYYRLDQFSYQLLLQME